MTHGCACEDVGEVDKVVGPTATGPEHVQSRGTVRATLPDGGVPLPVGLFGATEVGEEGSQVHQGVGGGQVQAAGGAELFQGLVVLLARGMESAEEHVGRHLLGTLDRAEVGHRLLEEFRGLGIVVVAPVPQHGQ